MPAAKQAANAFLSSLALALPLATSRCPMLAREAESDINMQHALVMATPLDHLVPLLSPSMHQELDLTQVFPPWEQDENPSVQQRALELVMRVRAARQSDERGPVGPFRCVSC